MADVGGADGSDDEQVELSQDQEVATLDMEIGGETEDSQSSPGTSSRLNTPPPLINPKNGLINLVSSYEIFFVTFKKLCFHLN